MRSCKLFLLPLALLAFVFVVGCKPGGGTFEDAKEMVSDTKTRIKTVSMQDFASIMDKGVDYKLIDCREPNEFKNGYMPGAINIPRGLLEFEIPKAIPDKSAKIYVYCKTGGRSALATESLNRLKYKDVTLVDGLWETWAKTYPNKVKK